MAFGIDTLAGAIQAISPGRAISGTICADARSLPETILVFVPVGCVMKPFLQRQRRPIAAASVKHLV